MQKKRKESSSFVSSRVLFPLSLGLTFNFSESDAEAKPTTKDGDLDHHAEEEMLRLENLIKQ